MSEQKSISVESINVESIKEMDYATLENLQGYLFNVREQITGKMQIVHDRMEDLAVVLDAEQKVSKMTDAQKVALAQVLNGSNIPKDKQAEEVNSGT